MREYRGRRGTRCLGCGRRLRAGARVVAVRYGVRGRYAEGMAHEPCALAWAQEVEAGGGLVDWGDDQGDELERG